VGAEIQPEHQVIEIRHTEEETMADEFTNARSRNLLIKQRGVTDQNSIRAYVKGDVRFERTTLMILR